MRTEMSFIPESLLEKIRRLPPDKQEEVSQFVEFLLARGREEHRTPKTANDPFQRVWDNPEDAVYDEL